MEDIITFLVGYLFAEFIVWGLFYLTGCVLTPVISLGRWHPESLIRDEKGKVKKGQSGIELVRRPGRIYLGAWGVAFVGFCFWVAVLVVVVIRYS